MTRLAYSFVALLLSLVVLLLGSGLLGTLLALRMELERFPTTTIGLVMACYSVGYVMATVWFGRIIVRVGHIRSFAILAAVASGSTLIYPLIIHPLPWALMRAVFGFAIAGLYMVTESWLNGRTPKEFRGRMLAFYGIATYAALGSGQFLINLWSVGEFQLFCLAALLLGVSLIPVALTRAPTPEVIETHPVRIRRLYQISPLGTVGSLFAGIMVGSFTALGPVFGRKVGLSVAEVSVLMGLSLLGGLLFQWPIGDFSDRFGRRQTIVAVAAGVAATSGLLILIGPDSELLLVMLSVLWGGLAFTIYPLSLAMTNDHIEPEELIGAGASLLLMHGVGLIIGPILLSQFMGWYGPWALFGVIAAIAVLLALFGYWRQQVGPTVTLEDQGEYVAVPTTTPFASTLDPRADDMQLELPFEADDAGDYSSVMLHKADLSAEVREECRRA